ncbi:MAG: tyrosine--tRNA ligase, partial [Firmicutes bacterium]|nr:tyrosine--tRNA ligase [Bacillota bacterium]MBR6025678.1 tyrosine--tRNA ligase [Bacillota bacterium]
AAKAQEAARALFGGGGDSAHMPTTKLDSSKFEGEGLGIVNLMRECGLIASNGEGFRTIQQGGLTLNDAKVTDTKYMVTLKDFKDGSLILKKGKKTFHKVEL